MNNKTNYNINFELDIYKAMMKCPFKTNNKIIHLEAINKIDNNYNKKNMKNESNMYIFDNKKIITKNIYKLHNDYEK